MSHQMMRRNAHLMQRVCVFSSPSFRHDIHMVGGGAGGWYKAEAGERLVLVHRLPNQTLLLCS